MVVVATLKDGRVISKEDISTLTRTGVGVLTTTVPFPDLRRYEYILHVETDIIDVFGEDNISKIGHWRENSNTVGLSIYAGNSTGTSLNGECIVIGY